VIGAIAGDIIGSVYERHRVKTKDFALFPPGSRFTDDTVLTVALADAILTGRDYGDLMKAYYRRYPHAGYGGMFRQWARVQGSPPYNSFGNGSAMRISPVGHAPRAFGTSWRRPVISVPSPITTRGHQGAQATAAAIFLARTGHAKTAIREYLESTFGYDLSRSLAQIRPGYRFDVTCQGSVPEAIIAFLESEDYEDAIRNAVSLGGDSDTQACITGGIAEAFYGGCAPRNRRDGPFADHRRPPLGHPRVRGPLWVARP
jgi:ADP-ribosylglycohydrolase